MATRSTIALEFADGTVQSVYCHWDGYLDHNGKILQEHYMDPFKVRQLIDLGSLSSLGAEIGVKHPFDNPHKYGTPEYKEFQDKYRNQCTFYGRDRGELDVEAQVFDNFRHYIEENVCQEYDYILRQVDGKPVWVVRCTETYDTWVSLERAFQASKEYAE